VDAVEGPILIAFDGSDAAQRAIADAARLLGPRRALVVTVWESGLAYAMQDVRVDGLVATPMIEPEVAMNVDREVSSQATRVAGEGAELARSLGFDAEPLAVPDERDIPETIVKLAGERHAAAIVVGSRGLSGLRARLEGSTTKGLLKHATCPVIVMHEPQQERPAGASRA
jgi:nucleotide-binding universal stress UspA family protein